MARTFKATDGATARIQVGGGPIRVTTAPARTIEVRLIASVRASSEAEADEALSNYDVVLKQEGDNVVVSTRRRQGQGWVGWIGHRRQVQFKAEVVAPSDVALDLDTSGGSIVVRGERGAALRADTSGGSITVDGGSGEIALDTSGGGIRVGKALRVLRADTSGGSITVDYVGATAERVDLQTSGGGIRVGVDRQASLEIGAATSGGSVSVDGLPLASRTGDRNSVAATLNGGAGVLRAHTSGGSIHISGTGEGAVGR